MPAAEAVFSLCSEIRNELVVFRSWAKTDVKVSELSVISLKTNSFEFFKVLHGYILFLVKYQVF